MRLDGDYILMYQNNKGDFISAVGDGYIANKIDEEFYKHNLSHNNDTKFKT